MACRSIIVIVGMDMAALLAQSEATGSQHGHKSIRLNCAKWLRTRSRQFCERLHCEWLPCCWHLAVHREYQPCCKGSTVMWMQRLCVMHKTWMHMMTLGVATSAGRSYSGKYRLDPTTLSELVSWSNYRLWVGWWSRKWVAATPLEP